MGRTRDAIDEGVAIASAAARLAVRNHILVETIAHDETFDPVLFTPFAQQTLLALADEQERAADRTHRQRKRAWGKFSDPDGTHDYRDRDTSNLRKRQRQYAGVAKRLREMAAEPDTVRAIIDESRDAAWHDVEANLDRRLSVEAMRPELDPDYEVMRAARMQSLRLIDLPRLAAHRRRLDSAADEPVVTDDGARRVSGVDVSELE